jgi:hypothetical protein
MTGPFDIAPVVARLKAGATSLRRVAGAAERAAAEKDAGAPTPAAYVVLARETPKPHSGGAGAFRQPVIATFIVVLAVRNVRLGELGVQGNSELKTAIEEVRGALLGWQPTPESTACELAGAELSDYDAGVIWWVEAFSTTYWVTR